MKLARKFLLFVNIVAYFYVTSSPWLVNKLVSYKIAGKNNYDASFFIIAKTKIGKYQDCVR
jgi:hypothetical protein